MGAHPSDTLPLASLAEADDEISALVRSDEFRLRRLHKQAAHKQIKCLDNAWRGMGALYHFQCSQGHGWKRNALNPEALSCPVCNPPPPQQPPSPQPSQFKLERPSRIGAHLLKDGLERLQRLAAEHGGECLSERYAGTAKYHHFRCANGHEWETKAGSIMQGSWCQRCAAIQKGQALRAQRLALRAQHFKEELARLQQIAHSKGGQCLSDTYSGSDVFYRFRCAKGHEWETRGLGIFSGRWCKRCAHSRPRLGLADAQQIARQHGGQCLSETYPGLQEKMRWTCHLGHVWDAAFSGIRQGYWCPQCARLERINGTRPPRPRIREIAAPPTQESDL